MTQVAETSVAIWESPRGLRSFADVNHKAVGARFIKTGFAFFLAGGILALLMRLQLIVPQNDFLGPQTYNEVFTMHGTTMMFLFAVPFLEGIANYLLPLMLGTRDLPFPRLNAFNYWCFLFAGLFLFSSFLFGAAPDGGWFAYPPLTGGEFSPGSNMDFWLLGVTLAEVSAIGAALEIVVSILKTRAPGMSINRLPLFAWAMLVVGVMIIFAFTPLATASLMLEADRKFGTQFFDPAGGGDPVLWQHLFWFFGHPEVYIMFLPAAGIVSQIVQTFSRKPIVGYVFVAFAIVATGFLSFGLWVHHMFTVGLPSMSMSFFTAASLVIGIAAGIQVFAWIATMWRSSLSINTSMLFVLGFLATFVLGGITGIMVAVIPFDLQVHDSYFLVAHFHYVLVGGVVFPAFAGLYYWIPKITGRLLGEGLGQLNFWLMFVGFNVAFFPMHVTGLVGMPRRVYTFSDDAGWAGLNLVSTIGALMLAAGVAVFLFNYWASRSRGVIAGDDPWGGDTLEWATASPPDPYNFRSIPVVASRTPLWHEGGIEAGPDDHPLRLAADRQPEWRAAVGTSPLEAAPQELIVLPTPTWWPVVPASGLLAALVGLLVDRWEPVLVGLALVAAGCFGWAWRNERERIPLHEERDLGISGPPGAPLGRWGATLLAVVMGTMLATLLFSYFFLRIKAPAWPPAGIDPPGLLAPLAAGLLLIAGGAVAVRMLRARHRGGTSPTLTPAVLALLGLGVAAILLLELVRRDIAVGDSAYASLYVALLGGYLVAVLIGLAMLAWVWIVPRAVGFPGRHGEVVANVALYWVFLSVAGPIVIASAYLPGRAS